MRGLSCPIVSVQRGHGRAAAGAEGAVSGAGGAAVGALAHPRGAHRVHRAAAVAAAGGRGGGAVRRGVRHLLEGAGGLGEEGQREEFIPPLSLPVLFVKKSGVFGVDGEGDVVAEVIVSVEAAGLGVDDAVDHGAEQAVFLGGIGGGAVGVHDGAQLREQGHQGGTARRFGVEGVELGDGLRDLRVEGRAALA